MKKINFILIFNFLIILTFINNANANYVENITIDCKLDDGYNQITNSNNYTIYYANNNDYNFIFIIFNFNLTNHSISIISGSFYYDISPEEVNTNFIHSKHQNNTLEIAISRTVVGDNIQINIDDIGLSFLIINPSEAPTDSESNESNENDKQEDNINENETYNIFGLIADWYDTWITPNQWWLSWVFGIMLGLFIVFITRYFAKPIVFIRDNTTNELRDRKLGRIVDCYQAKHPLSNYWIHVYKTEKGIKEYYHYENFESFRKWLETSKLPPFEKYAGHIIAIEVVLPEYMRPPLQIRRKRIKRSNGKYRRDYLNWFKYWFIYRFACLFIPSGWLSYKLRNIVKYEFAKDKKGNIIKKEKITVLVHEATLKHITTVVDIKYKYRTFKEGKEKIEERIERGVPLHFLKDLERDKDYIPNTLERISEPYEEVKRYNTPEEALKQIASKAELESIHEIEMQQLTNELEKTKKELFEANERLRKMQVKIWDYVDNALKEKQNESILKGSDLIHIVAKSMGIYELSGDIEHSIKQAIIEYLDKKFIELNSDKLIESAALKRESELLKEFKNDLKELKKSMNDRYIEIKPLEDDLKT
ncbi:MAG: hypothetical protein ACP6IY_18800 [Promethearchaeia archaeon]